MTFDEEGPPEGDDLVELCQDAGVSVEHIMTLYEHVHHHEPMVNLQKAMGLLDLSEDCTRRVFRLASLAFECHETGATLFHIPDFARSISETLDVDPYYVAAEWDRGMGELREELLDLFNGKHRGKELKFQLEECERRWQGRLIGNTWKVFMTLTVAEAHFEESVSEARFTIKKTRTQEETNEHH